MKMQFLSTGLFWGAVLILMGLSVILKAVFNIDIPVLRALVGLLFIYFGIQILVGERTWKNRSCDVVFNEAKVTADSRSGEYNVIFGKGVIDFTGVEIKDKDMFLKANTIFGSSMIRLKANLPALIKANSAFGNVRLPDGNSAAFGNYLYKTKAYQEGKPHLELETNTVFGDTHVAVEE